MSVVETWLTNPHVSERCLHWIACCYQKHVNAAYKFNTQDIVNLNSRYLFLTWSTYKVSLNFKK